MLGKKYRLTKGTRFSSSASINSPFFTLKTLNNGLLYNRYGFVVSKKVDKRAVVRNRAKRVFRSYIEELNSALKQGYDMLFLIRKEVLNVEREKLCLSIKSTLQKEGFFK